MACIAKTVYDTGGNHNGRIDPGETVDLTATLENVGGFNFTNLATTLESDDPYITITDNSGLFGALAVDSIKENTSDPYTLTASASAPHGHTAEFRLLITEGAYVDTFELSFVIGSYHYMVWNPDPTPAPGAAMHSALTGLGYTGTYSTSLLTETDLEMYRAVFVCVGIYPYNYVISATSPEATALTAYMAAGGNVYLEGGDVWYYDPLGSGYNFCPLFGLTATSDGTSDGGPFIGQIGTFTQSMSFNYAGENSYIDHISPAGAGSMLIFRDGDQNYDCGVAYDADMRKTVGLSFELGGLVDAGGVSTRAVLLDSIMHFFDITTGIDELTNLEAHNLSLQVMPNPFSKLTKVSFGIEQSAERIALQIYDATGRLVRDFSHAMPHAPCAMQISWDGKDQSDRQLPSGVYFVKLDAGTETATRKVILVD